MTAAAVPHQAPAAAPRRTTNRPLWLLVLNLVAVAVAVAVAAGLGVWALLSAIIGVQGLPGPWAVAGR